MIRRRLKHTHTRKRVSVRFWNNALKDVPCFLIGCGPWLENQPTGLLNDFFTIGINSCYLKIDPTILLWQDIEFWYNAKRDIPKLSALKYCRDTSDPSGTYYSFRLTPGFYKIPKDASQLHGRGNSGALAFELAYILGCNPIVLVGFDCRYQGKKTDFYGANPHHKQHTLRQCKNALKWIKEESKNSQKKQRKIDIINCSKNEVFGVKYKLRDGVDMVREKYSMLGRDYFVSKILDNAARKKKKELNKRKNTS